LFLEHHQQSRKQSQGGDEEMSISVLDTYAVTADAVDEEHLPCRRENPELFFAETPQDVEVAKALCLGCPVRAECLAGALERREPWGVWGGELFLQGVVIPRKRPRGRPRKNEVAA
jgi:WhiB family redox-sensing transcriptional regulator